MGSLSVPKYAYCVSRDRRFRRCVTAVAAGCLVGVVPVVSPSALHASNTSTGAAGAPGFEPVTDSVLRVLQRSSTAKVIVTADETALTDDRVREILGQMTPVGDSSYAGRLSGATIDDLAESGAALVDIDATIRVPNIPMAARPGEVRPTIQPAGLWDADVTIPDTDSRLVSSQQQVGIDGTGSVVVVMDTGVDSNASGLAGQVIHRQDFSTPPSSCTDRGFLDPNGHGTHVASIIAGKPGNFTPSNMRGVAPGAKIIDVRVFDCAAETTDSEVLNAIDWIIANKSTYGIDAVNMSLGSSGTGQTGQDSKSIAVNRMVAAGLFVAVAAGNDGDVPGTIGSPGVAQFATTVGAATVSKYGSYQAFYSSTGPTGDGRAGIDFLAPGSGIIAAQTTAVQIAGGGTVKGGTSMAAPYVAGIAALLAQQHPNEAPSGTTCDIGVGCPIGVVAASMTNPIQDRIKASDWYTAGIDNMSGRGLVSASATVLGESPAAAKSISGAFRSDAPNSIRIPPHAGNAIVSIYTPTPVNTDMWDAARLHIQLVDESYGLKRSEVPCTKSASGVCATLSFGFTTYLYAFLLRPSQTDTYLQVVSPKSLDFHMTFTGLENSPSLAARATSTHVNLSSSTTGTITISRVVTSASPTVFTVNAPAVISAASTVTLPAGAAGTSVSLAVERTGQIRYSEETVLLSGDDGSLLASRVQMRTTGDGRIVYPNTAGFSDRGENWDTYFVADDGTIVMNSRATGLKGSNGYDSVGIVPVGSLVIEKVNLVQTSPSQLEVEAVAADGSAFIGYQFPAGAGLLPGDTDTRENYFVYSRSSGSLTEIGPDTRPYGQMFLMNSRYSINNDGSEVAWSVNLPSGTDPVRLGWQGGTNFSTTRILDSFPATTIMRLVSFRGSHILVSVQANDSAPVEYRDYDSNGDYQVVSFGSSGSSVSGMQSSPDGSAIAGFKSDDSVVCLDNGASVVFDNTYAQRTGFNYGVVNAVANDCSWLTTTWTFDREYPKANSGRRLVKLFANGTMVELDRAPAGRLQAWLGNATGTHVVRLTPDQLEPGDTNGGWDYYRGVSGASSAETLGPWVEPTPPAPSPPNPTPPFVTVPPATNNSPVSNPKWTPPTVNWAPEPAPKTITSIAVGGTKSRATLARLAKMKVLSTSRVSVRIASSSAKFCKLSTSGVRSLKAGSCRVTITVTPRSGAATSKVVIVKTVRS